MNKSDAQSLRDLADEMTSILGKWRQAKGDTVAQAKLINAIETGAIYLHSLAEKQDMERETTAEYLAKALADI